MVDTVIKNGMICDGSGSEPRPGELLLHDGRIAEIAPPGSFAVTGGEVIDAAGKIVAPGFIDVHAHGDTMKLRFPQRRSVLLQGITTEVDGNCGDGSSCVPRSAGEFRWNGLDEYVKIIDSLDISVNTVVLAGHNFIRRVVMGENPGKASAEDIRAMRKLLENALESGAAGWSTGLTYFPGKFSDTAELCALSEVTRGSEKIYATHLRSEGDQLLEAVDEAAAVARAGSGRLQISHLKTIFPRNFSKAEALLELIEQHRKTLDIHADRYPYVYSSTGISQCLPEPYCKMPDIAAKLRASAEFREEVTGALKNSPRDLATTILISRQQTLAGIAAQQNSSCERVCMEMLMENPSQNAAYLCMSEANLRRFLALPYLCAGTDGISAQLDDPSVTGHPRAVGSFPRFFRMVSELASPGEAIRRMSGLPAEIFRIPERGFIRKNYIADLVIFEADKLDSQAGFSRENLEPCGIDKVLLRGQIAWDSSRPEEVHAHGRFIAVS